MVSISFTVFFLLIKKLQKLEVRSETNMFPPLIFLLTSRVAIPINKQLYSFSYVCFTAGAAGIVFCGFYTLVKKLDSGPSKKQ